jgi:hypothetical protein
VAAYRRKFSPSLFRHVRSPKAGVTYLGSSPFKYRDVAGKEQVIQPGAYVQRRQYENLRYQSGGWRSKAEYEKITHGHLKRKVDGRHVHEADAYRAWARIYGEEHDVPMRGVMGPDTEFSRAFIAAYRDNFSDTSSTSPFAHLLVITGLRDETDTWDVGETDPK